MGPPAPDPPFGCAQNYSSTSFTGQPFRFLQRTMLPFLFLFVSVNETCLVPSAIPLPPEGTLVLNTILNLNISVNSKQVSPESYFISTG